MFPTSLKLTAAALASAFTVLVGPLDLASVPGRKLGPDILQRVTGGSTDNKGSGFDSCDEANATILGSGYIGKTACEDLMMPPATPALKCVHCKNDVAAGKKLDPTGNPLNEGEEKNCSSSIQNVGTCVPRGGGVPGGFCSNPVPTGNACTGSFVKYTDQQP